MQRLVILAVFLLSFAPRVSEASSLSSRCAKLAAYLGNPRDTAWHAGMNFDEVEELLALTPVKSMQPIQEALGIEAEKGNDGENVQLVTLRGGLKGALRFAEAAEQELFGYRFSRKVQSRIVPPTVKRDFKFAHGLSTTLQLFIPPKEYFHLSSVKRRELFEKMSEQDRFSISALAFVLGHWDLHPGNMVIDEALAPALFDFGDLARVMKVRYGEMAFIPIGETDRVFPENEEFPFDQFEEFETPEDQLDLVMKKVAARFPELSANMLFKIKNRIYSSTRSIKLIHWNSTIWMQRVSGKIVPFSKKYFKKEFKPYQALTRDDVKALAPSFWSERLIDQVIERRDLMSEYYKVP